MHRLSLDRHAFANQIFAGDDELLVTRKAFHDFHTVLGERAQFNRYLVGFPILDDIDILGFLEPAHGIQRNLNRLGMFSDQDLDAGEHAAFETMVFIRQIHFHGHRAGGAVQGLNNARDPAFEDLIGIGLGANVGPLPDL